MGRLLIARKAGQGASFGLGVCEGRDRQIERMLGRVSVLRVRGKQIVLSFEMDDEVIILRDEICQPTANPVDATGSDSKSERSPCSAPSARGAAKTTTGRSNSPT